MKNFFKKLSFVLAIAMVLTSIAPATASAAEVVPAKKVNIKVDGEKVDAISIKVDETKTIKVGLPVKKAFEGQKSTFKTYYSVEGTAVEVTKVGNRTYEVTAVEAGEATITIGAAKTKALAEAGEFKKVDTLKVTVEADTTVAVKQTGANKITVTGTDLTETLSDYVIKRGSVTLATKAITPNEEKTEVVIEAAASNMPKGDYTLTFKDGEAVEFTVEAAVVDSIVIDPECAILADGTNKNLVTYYKVFNQFGEDVTSGPLGATVQASGSDDPQIDRAKKQVTFHNDNGYTLNLSQVSLALVSNANGVNTSKILTVSEASKLAGVEFVGLFKAVAGKYVPATLKEGASASDLAGHYLFFQGVDQYNRPYGEVDGKLQVNALSTTGLKVNTAAAITDPVTYATYIPYTLDTTAGLNGGKLAAGTISLMTVVLNNGSTSTATVEVVPGTKVDTLIVSDLNGIYGNQWNELYFEAYDVDGNPITDYATLSQMNNSKYIQSANVEFDRNPDGTASLWYYADPNPSPINVPAILTFLTPTNKFTSANVNIQPDCVPKAIVGIDSDVALGAVEGKAVTIVRKNLKFQDQYGNIMADDSVALKSVTLTAIAKGATYNFAGTLDAASGQPMTAQTTSVLNTGIVNTSTTGAVTMTIAIEGVEGSDYTFNVYSVALDDMVDFEVGDLYYPQKAGVEFNLETLCDSYRGAGVFGYYNGVKVRLASTDYQVIDANEGNTVTAPAIYAEYEGYVTKEGSFKVLILNKAGTVISKTFSYSNTAPKTELSVSSALPFYWTREMAVASNTAASGSAAAVKASTITAKDQYGNASTSTMYITYSEYPTDENVCVVTANGTADAKIMFKVGGYFTVKVKYSTLDGAEFEQYVTFKVVNEAK